jgi:hypothetical protein
MRINATEQALRSLVREHIELIEIAQFQNVDGDWQDDIMIPEDIDVSIDDSLSEVLKKKIKSKKYKGEKYSASAGSIAAIRKYKGSVKKAVASGAFDWASNPMAAAQAAHIVALGSPTVPSGSKKKD